jgi:hypothetical protein
MLPWSPPRRLSLGVLFCLFATALDVVNRGVLRQQHDPKLQNFCLLANAVIVAAVFEGVAGAA